VTDIDLPGATECTAVDLDATGRWLNEAVYERLSTVVE